MATSGSPKFQADGRSKSAATKHLRCEIGHAAQQAAAAREDDTATRFGGERRRHQPIARHFEDFLDAGLDDLGQCRPRHELRRLLLITGGARQSDHVAFVHATGQHTAIERLDSLGIVKAGGQSRAQDPV